MAKLRPRQLEYSKTGPSKLGFDGEEDGWVFVKKQRIFIVLPSLPPPQHFTFEKPAITSQSQAELRDGLADTQESTFVHTLVPLPEHFISHKPRSQAELRDVIADTHKPTPLHTVVPSLPRPKQFILQKPDTIAETHETAPLHTVVPSLPVTEHFTLQKSATSQPQAELRDLIADTHTTPLHSVVPSLLATEQFTLQKPATSQSKADLRDFIADTQETTPLDTVVSSLPLSEHSMLQKPATSQSQAELRVDTHETTLVNRGLPSHPVPEHCTLQKPGTSKSQSELRTETLKATLVHTVVPSLPVTEHYTLQKPATSQSQTELRSDTRKATLVQRVVPSLQVIEQCTMQKPQAELRDLVADTQDTKVHTMEPEACPDFTSVDKPEMVMGHNLTTRKGPAPRRSLQDRMNLDRRVEIHKSSRTSHKPVRFPRVMCSSVVMDNEKLRVLNLEKKVEKAGGLNEWVGSIGLGRVLDFVLLDVFLQYFADRDIFCAGRVAEEDLNRVAAAAGGTVQTSVNNIITEVLGTCEVFEEKQVGGERFNIFSGCPSGRTATIVLRGGADQFIEEAERSLHDAIMIVRRAVKNSTVVPGGGAIDMEISKYLRQHSRTIAGKSQLFINSYAKALEVIPRQLCDNAGFDATDVLNKLRQKHAMQSGEGASYGVDINTGGIADSFANFVWEPAVVKINAINAATEAACLILSVDETVKNPKSESAQGDAAAGAMGRGRGGGRGRGMRRR